jgi:dihydrodipicolinate synthase/N-acetylneuraminate lyase
MANSEPVRQTLGRGLVIPACPLALSSGRRLDERRQRALFRYYLAAGAGGLAVGVHTTQFAIRNPAVGLFQPVLELAAEELNHAARSRRQKEAVRGQPSKAAEQQGPGGRLRAPAAAARVRVAGVCGRTQQAVAEASIARQLGYHSALLSLGALKNASDDELLAHCRAVAQIIPLMGFYLQPAAGGRALPHSFWRHFAEIEEVVAVKIAPFNRYQTLDVVRAIAESGRNDIALYTGNDDNFVLDLLTPFRFNVGGQLAERRIVGGLLGHWAVWTKRAVELHAECRCLAQSGDAIPAEMLRRNVEVTDANAALFDASHGFAGCIPGIHEVLRRQGLLEGIWCLDPNETLSPGQRGEIDRVYRAYPHLNDDEFVAQHREEWLKG